MKLPKGLSIVTVQNIKVAKLYQTNIVTVMHNGGSTAIILNSGGWSTKHTKKCMNLVLAQYGITVKQKDFNWFIITPAGASIPFQDGVTLAA